MPNRRAQAMSAGKSQARNPNGTLVRLLWIAVLFLAVIGLVAAVRRTIFLLKPGALGSPRNPASQLRAHFDSERALALTHILPARLFMLLVPPQFALVLR